MAHTQGQPDPGLVAGSSEPAAPSFEGAERGKQGGPELAGVLAAAAAGDQGAWRTIVDLYARRVYALARSRLGRRGSTVGLSDGWSVGDDDAEEVTQSVFCTIASKISTGEYSEQGRFESWLFRVAMNRIRDEARRRRRHPVPTDPEGLGDRRPHDADPAATSDTEIIALRAAMEQLGEADREILELRHHAGMSFKQMASMLDEPLGTLLARHHRALRKLKELMEEGPSGDGEGKADQSVRTVEDRP